MKKFLVLALVAVFAIAVNADTKEKKCCGKAGCEKKECVSKISGRNLNKPVPSMDCREVKSDDKATTIVSKKDNNKKDDKSKDQPTKKDNGKIGDGSKLDRPKK